MESVGLYLHTPFCVSKCPYCDFHSAPPSSDADLDAYTDALLSSMDHWAGRYPLTADTLYFGGGTPSLLGGARLAALICRPFLQLHQPLGIVLQLCCLVAAQHKAPAIADCEVSQHILPTGKLLQTLGKQSHAPWNSIRYVDAKAAIP